VQSKKSMSGRKILILSLLSLSSGLTGTFIGRAFISSTETSQPWIVPAILIGSIAFILVGALLFPTALIVMKNDKRGPVA
jgi:H+/Cl- antiporter ClcA